MPPQQWRVVGGGEGGGILVREGRELASPQLPERLRTGSVLLQLELVGSRLRYQKVGGTGPETGWVSLKQKERDLCVPVAGVEEILEAAAQAADGAQQGVPLLVCLYCGGMTSRQGQAHMAAFLTSAVSIAGVTDHIVLDHATEPGFEECTSWEAYLDSLVAKVSGPGLDGRPLLIFAHSHGCLAAYGLALRLGARVLKLYAVARRPPSQPLLDEVWGVATGQELDQMGDDDLLRGLLGAWRNPFLESKAFGSPISPIVGKIMHTVRKQYSSPCAPTGSLDMPAALGESLEPIVAPILAVACSRELPAGETTEKMEGWRELTVDKFDLVTVDLDHMDCMEMAAAENPMFGVVLRDMRQFCTS